EKRSNCAASAASAHASEARAAGATRTPASQSMFQPSGSPTSSPARSLKSTSLRARQLKVLLPRQQRLAPPLPPGRAPARQSVTEAADQHPLRRRKALEARPPGAKAHRAARHSEQTVISYQCLVDAGTLPVSR